MNPWQFIVDVATKWVPGALLWLSQPTDSSAPFMLVTSSSTGAQAATYLSEITPPSAQYESFFHFWKNFSDLSFFVSLIFLALIIYCIVRILQIREFEKRRFEAAAHTVVAQDVPRTHLRWNRIRDQIGSDNEQDWRLAILEADIMLNELLDTRGYRGETMADKMREVERGDFNTIDLAWEAHRMRNRIVHEGTNISLNEREARRIIGLYETVFREFNFVE